MEIFIGRKVNPNLLADILNMAIMGPETVTVKYMDELPHPQNYLPSPEQIPDDMKPLGENVIRNEV